VGDKIKQVSLYPSFKDVDRNMFLSTLLSKKARETGFSLLFFQSCYIVTRFYFVLSTHLPKKERETGLSLLFIQGERNRNRFLSTLLLKK
jgi:hypothetical protein